MQIWVNILFRLWIDAIFHILWWAHLVSLNEYSLEIVNLVAKVQMRCVIEPEFVKLSKNLLHQNLVILLVAFFIKELNGLNKEFYLFIRLLRSIFPYDPSASKTILIIFAPRRLILSFLILLLQFKSFLIMWEFTFETDLLPGFNHQVMSIVNIDNICEKLDLGSCEHGSNILIWELYKVILAFN